MEDESIAAIHYPLQYSLNQNKLCEKARCLQVLPEERHRLLHSSSMIAQ